MMNEPSIAFAEDLRRHCTYSPPSPESWVHGLRHHQERDFALMNQAFYATGGFMDGDVLAGHMRASCDQPISAIARWIVRRQVVSIVWQSQLILPRFQFEQPGMSRRASVTRIIDELKDVFDNWDLALWFAQPNAWLDDSAPVDLIATDERSVHEAARADRFIALG